MLLWSTSMRHAHMCTHKLMPARACVRMCGTCMSMLDTDTWTVNQMKGRSHTRIHWYVHGNLPYHMSSLWSGGSFVGISSPQLEMNVCVCINGTQVCMYVCMYVNYIHATSRTECIACINGAHVCMYVCMCIRICHSSNWMHGMRKCVCICVYM